MTDKQTILCERLKRLGFARDSQMRLYGTQFELVSDPVIIGEHAVFVDAVETKTGEAVRVRIPLNIVNMATEDRIAA